VGQLRISPAVIDKVTRDELAELSRREIAYRGRRGPLPVRGRVAILVDDGLATGATARAAALAVRKLEPARVVLAVPVAPPQALPDLAAVTDDVVCPLQPEPFEAVGRWYRDFRPTSDAEVRALLADQHSPAQEHPAAPPGT
jgi:putative phosphoribosyl transferase